MVIVGVDAHKRTHTLLAIDGVGRKLGEKTVTATTEGHREGLVWARRRFGRELLWAIEDCRAVTARLERDLIAHKQQVVRVPTTMMSRARDTLRTRGKSDAIDALAVARAAQREPNLPVASHNEVSWEMKLLVDRRDDLVAQRIATGNRLLWRVHWLDPEQPVKSLNAKSSRKALSDWLSVQKGLVAELARDELADIDRVIGDIEAVNNRIQERIEHVAPTLLRMQGCGHLTAAKIIAETAGIHRFKSEAAWARYVGVAPKNHSSAGDTAVPFRMGRSGNRQLNMAIHRIAVTQVRRAGAGQTYFQRRLQEGNARAYALRCLKRQVARAVYRALRVDEDLAVSPSQQGPPKSSDVTPTSSPSG